MNSGDRSGNTGRDRLASISWVVVIIGIATFLCVCVAHLLFAIYQADAGSRLFMRVSVPGVAELWKELGKLLWMLHRTKMMTTMKLQTRIAMLLAQSSLQSEFLAGCLPTLAPLLNIRVHLQNLSASLRSQFTSRGRAPGSRDSRTGRSQYNRELDGLKLLPDGAATMVSGASAKHSAIADEDDDLSPWHSVVIRQDVDTRETGNWDKLAYVEDLAADCDGSRMVLRSSFHMVKPRSSLCLVSGLDSLV